MTIEDQIKDEKLQYDINREAAKISVLSSGKLDKHEHLTDEEILILFPLKSSENRRFSDDFRGNRSYHRINIK